MPKRTKGLCLRLFGPRLQRSNGPDTPGAWCSVSAGTCTRCGQVGLIRLSGTLDWDVPYQLCANCYGVGRDLDDDAHKRFAIDLWQRAAVQHLEPCGTA